MNNCLYVGPQLIPLFEILLRFKEFRAPLVADIEKAFIKCRNCDTMYLGPSCCLVNFGYYV